MIHTIRAQATPKQMAEMMETLDTYIKLAVDVRQEILAGGGTMHADCEAALLKEGCAQVDIWGADWNPSIQEVTYESLINIRPRQNNRKMEIEDPELRQKIERIVTKLLGGVEVGDIAGD
ncbi:hypothetical protein H8E88_25550 [candidate division KSB1 bacterium]|nr:hypothetical protein [candidate division KSB1 bacterium]